MPESMALAIGLRAWSSSTALDAKTYDPIPARNAALLRYSEYVLTDDTTSKCAGLPWTSELRTRRRRDSRPLPSASNPLMRSW
jgi:hypothetical protein